MGTKPWRRAEEKIAKMFGGKRIKHDGVEGADVDSDWATVQVKYRKKLPEWIVNAVRNAQDYSTADKLPCAALVEANTGKTLIIIDAANFDLWFGASKGGRP